MSRVAPLQNDALDEDPVFLQALLDSYMEQAAGLSSTNQQQRFSGDSHDPSKLGQTPPASAEMIKNLPLLELREEDLIDPVNRECCVCLDDNFVGDKAVRLPHCCHIFHKKCIIDWLERKCTCPVCRFEHPTDDPHFEKERLERQKESKPRYARHELNRMPYPNLVALIPNDDDRADAEKKYQGLDLVNHLIESGVVDLINVPVPVTEYPISTLQKMSVSQLRKVMNKEAGVYWHSKEISTREQMIDIFLASGRVDILPEPLEDPRENTTKEGTTVKQQKLNLHPNTDRKTKRVPLRKRIRLFRTCRNSTR